MCLIYYSLVNIKFQTLITKYEFLDKIMSMQKVFLQELNNYNAGKELENIGFDRLYLDCAKLKYEFKTLKFCKLKAIEANILKQTALSLSSDCAVHRNVILNAEGEFDCLISASISTFLKIAEKLKLQQFRLKEIAQLIEENILPSNKEKILKIRGKELNFSKEKYLMGILNITPDSFSDGGEYFTKDAVGKQFIKLVKQNADIIDIGAQTTKPDFQKISVEEECKRLNLLFENDIFINSTIIKSIDTFNYKTAQFAIENGCDIINDVSGFNDKNMIKLASDYKVPVILMFNQKMQEKSDKDTFSQMYEFFVNKIDELVTANINKNKIIIDCGFGFFSDNSDNVKILSKLANLKALNCPVLLGISRKSFIKKFDFFDNFDEASMLISTKYLDNVDIFRVHDVEKHKKMIDLFSGL